MSRAPAMPAEVAAVFGRWPNSVRGRLLEARALIFDVAADCEAGPLTETLKWGEPAYLTEATRAGTTIRLGWSPEAPDRAAMFVSCQTGLVDRYRARFGGELDFERNRGVRIALDRPLQDGPLGICIAEALTYHRAKRRRVARG